MTNPKHKFQVLTPLKFNGKKIKVGGTVSMTLDQASPLVGLKALAGTDHDPDGATAGGNDGGGESGLPSERPSEPAAVLEAIRQAGAKLDPANEDHWTKAGKADTRALESLLGWDVSAAERDESGVVKPE